MELPEKGLAAITADGVEVFGGGSPAYPARETVRTPVPEARAEAVPDGFVEGPTPRPLVARFRVRETGIYGEVPYVEEWKPLPPRLHSFAEVERPAPGGRFAIGVREVTGATGSPLTGLTLAEARAYAAEAGRAPPDRGRVAARGRGRPARARRAARLELDGERAPRRADALRDPQGRLRLEGRGLGLVRRRRPAGARLLAPAAADRADGALDEHRLPPGGRSAMNALDDVKVLEAATLFAAPIAGMLLGDFGAEVIKIEHPSRPDPARGHGPAKDGEGLWFKSLARNKRLITLDLSKPGGRDVFLRLAEERRRRPRELPPGHPRALGRRPGRALGRQPAPRGRPRDGLRAERAHTPSRPGFGTLAEAMSGFAALNGEPGSPPLLPPLALADGVTGLATAFSVLTALHARERTGRGQIVDASLIEPLMTLLGPQIAAWDLLGELQPRTGNLSSHNAPRNVYATADGGWVAVSSSATSIAERVLRLVGRDDLAAQPWFATGAGRVAHVEEIDAAVAAWIGERTRDEVLAAFETPTPPPPRSTTRATSSPTRTSWPPARSPRSRTTASERSGCRAWSRGSRTRRAGSSSQAARTAPTPTPVLGELGLSPEEIADLREQGAV